MAARRERLPRNRERDIYVDLTHSDYFDISNLISKTLKKVESGELVNTNPQKLRYAIVRSVNEGGYTLLPRIEDMLQAGLRSTHSFDLEFIEDSSFEQEVQTDVQLRLYGDGGENYEIARCSDTHFVPSWTTTYNGRFLDAESPMGDHLKLSDSDLIATLWSLTHDGNERDFSGLSVDSIKDAACDAIATGQASAERFTISKTYRSDGFDERDLSDEDAVPGASLTVTHTQIKNNEHDTHEETEYSLTYAIPEVLSSPEGKDIWVWVIYSFTVQFNENNDIERVGATTDIAFKTPEDELFVSSDWVDKQRLIQQSGIQQDFKGLVIDALSDLFPKNQ